MPHTSFKHLRPEVALHCPVLDGVFQRGAAAAAAALNGRLHGIEWQLWGSESRHLWFRFGS